MKHREPFANVSGAQTHMSPEGWNVCLPMSSAILSTSTLSSCGRSRRRGMKGSKADEDNSSARDEFALPGLGKKTQSMQIVVHYDDVIMIEMASQITSLAIVYSIVYSDAEQRKHQSSASLAFVRGIHRGPVNSPHKRPVTRKMFPFDDVIMHSLSKSA